MTTTDVAAICRAALGARWLGQLDGHRCACGNLTANNGQRRLCVQCGACYPLDSAPPVYRQTALFAEGASA